MAMSLTIIVSLRRSPMNALTQLAELAIGDDERPKGSNTSEQFIAMLLGGFLLHRGAWELGVLDIDLFSVPNELL